MDRIQKQKVLIIIALLTGIFQAGPYAAAGSREKPNIILIGVDTLRADHLGCYGYARKTSPAIDALADESVLFVRCISHMPGTTPSFATIMTSKRPISHGVLDNNYAGYRLDEHHVTLAEILKREGYETAAFVGGSTLNRDARLDQGFDVYEDTSKDPERSAATVTRDALLWLDGERDAPFFLFIHYFDPHGKYSAPSPFDKAFFFTRKEGDLSMIPLYQRRRNIADPSYYIAQYDGEIAYVDHNIGKIIGKLPELGIDEETIIVLTSDHGETMNEHLWWFDHGCYLYEEQIRVPLLLWYPRMLSPAKIDGLVRHIDILPTVLAVLGIDAPQEAEGRSLLPLVRGDGTKEIEFVYSEGTRGSTERDAEMRDGIAGKQFAVRSRRWKLLRTVKTTGTVYELYDLESDPEERHDLIETHGVVSDDLKERLEAFVASYKASPYYEAGLELEAERRLAPRDETENERLKSLGYAQ
jgi:arylsulfatase